MKQPGSTHNWLHIALVLAALAALFSLTSCQRPPATTTPQLAAAAAVDQADFTLVTADKLQVARPANWELQSTEGAVYVAALTPTIRITVAALDPQPQDDYDSLVAAGTVQRSEVNGLARYQNDYVYELAGAQLVSRCCTVVSGASACHIMFVCDVAVLDKFGPVFDYIVASVRFVQP